MVTKAENNFIKNIKLKNFLSYGPDGVELKLQPLNVFIGPNSSGKSNLIEALRIMRAAAQTDPEKDISGEMSKRGGLSNWIWKGETSDRVVEMQLYTESDFPFLIQYNLKFQETAQRIFEINEESLFRLDRIGEKVEGNKADYYYQKGFSPIIVTYEYREIFSVKKEIIEVNSSKPTRAHDLDLNKSILSQRKDPVSFPNITYLAKQFSDVRIYRGWNLEYNSPIRLPQDIGKPKEFLLEDASNLSVIISNLLKIISTQKLLEDNLKKFYPNFIDLDFGTEGGIQIRVEEKGLYEKIPATKLSDGFLRFLCLLSILCHPKPPSVICLEEPELNMHPDIIPTIADLLVEASSRTQLFVTTHSDILVSALTNYPESVVICERNEDGTNLKRLKKKDLLEEWLEKYKLGELWLMNKIGGNP